MNIDEYRALKAQEQTDSQKGEQTDAQTHEGATANPEIPGTQTEQTEPVPTDTGTQTEAPPVQEQTQTDVPQTVEINGEQVSLDELKNGYLRQSDYTRKTQEVAEQRKELAYLAQLREQLEANPELAKQIAQEHNLTALDPAYAEQAKREQEYWDMKLEFDLQSMEKQYTDFDRQTVLQTAFERKVSLEDAYLITKANQPAPPTQVEPIPSPQGLPDLEKFKQDLLAELKKELVPQPQVDTSTIITTRNGVAPVRDTTPQLSHAEMKVAQAMGMTAEEYAKWR